METTMESQNLLTSARPSCGMGVSKDYLHMSYNLNSLKGVILGII